MRLKIIFYLTILASALLLFGCGGSGTANNSSNANAPVTNTNTASANQNSIEPTKKAEVETTNNAPTLSPVVKAYCEAMIKKDDAALRKVYSSDTLAILEKDMKDEGKTSLVEFLSEIEPIKDASKCTARNEKIEGDKAIANIKNENMPNGIDVEFVKENGEWKLTNKSPEINSVKESATSPGKESDNKSK